MKPTFVLFIAFRSWLRYGRRPHFSELAGIGNLIVVEEPLKIFSKEFLRDPIKSILNYIKYSSGIRKDCRYEIRIIRPILLFSSKLQYSYTLFNRIDHFILSFQLRKVKVAGDRYFYMLTNLSQEWLIKKNPKIFYYLDIDDEWSMITYEKSLRNNIETNMRRFIEKIDLATAVTIKLQRKYNNDNKVYFLPNAVDVNHYSPCFLSGDNRVKEKSIDELSVNIDFLKKGKNDPRIYLTNLDKMKNIKKPIAGSISGLSGNWSDFGFMHKVEKLLPYEFSLVSSGNIHPPTNPSFAGEYKDYMSSQRMLYLGYVDYSALSDFLKFLDVGIVMHRMDEFNKHSAPNKIWAYLAMGLPVVCTDFLNDYDKDIYEGLVNFAKTPEEYVEFIVNESQTNNIEKRKKRRELAERYSTIKRAERLYKMILVKSKEGIV